jgi:radical S-adenosyl methionine domain-containing protein 2
MVLLSLPSEVPALRFFVVVVLTTCAYIVHKQSASKPVKNFPHETAVHEVPAESPVFEAQEASHPSKPPDTPVSANYFPSQEFNYKCGFCFHTETSSYILTHDKAPKGLKLLKEAGMRKLNIASGEPFLHPKFLSSRFATAKRIWVSKHQYRQ